MKESEKIYSTYKIDGVFFINCDCDCKQHHEKIKKMEEYIKVLKQNEEAVEFLVKKNK